MPVLLQSLFFINLTKKTQNLATPTLNRQHFQLSILKIFNNPMVTLYIDIIEKVISL